MKLVRYGEPGAEKPGAIDGRGRVRELSGQIDDVAGDALLDGSLSGLRASDLGALPLAPETVRLGPCVGSVGKIVGIGLNYSDHAAETGLAAPDEPILFMKATTSLSGPFDPVVIPKGSTKTDWEVELGVVIGDPARCVGEDSALDHVAGYCVFNDVSERAHQLEGTGQWVKGKSADTFAPIGPWFVTADEIVDPQSLGLWLEVNGERVQDSSTSNMIFGVRYLVSYVSQYMPLMPGDIIATGTPVGVGLGFKPPRFLSPGGRMRLGVDGLGVQEQDVVSWPG